MINISTMSQTASSPPAFNPSTPVHAAPTPAGPMSVGDLNKLSCEAFTGLLGGIFEHSPWIAQAAWQARPFSSVEHLHTEMVRVLGQSSQDKKLGLICAHPELAGKEAQENLLTADSKNEQKGAGLDQCSPDELKRLRSLNQAYREKFGFPFVVAVKGLTRHQILDQIASRMNNPKDEEFDRCLHEISKIAAFRLHAQFAAPVSA